MRAFIARPLELIERHFGDALVIGSMHSRGTLRIREFLTRNGHPFTSTSISIATRTSQAMLDRFHVRSTTSRSSICRGADVLRQPDERGDRGLPRLEPRDRSRCTCATS